MRVLYINSEFLAKVLALQGQNNQWTQHFMFYSGPTGGTTLWLAYIKGCNMWESVYQRSLAAAWKM